MDQPPRSGPMAGKGKPLRQPGGYRPLGPVQATGADGCRLTQEPPGTLAIEIDLGACGNHGHEQL